MPLPELRVLSADYAAAPSAVQEDWPAVVAAGYRSVINHRPDHEDGPRQRTAKEIGAAVRALGLAYVHQPVPDVNFGADAVAQLAELLRSLPGPVLAFCRSGRRSSLLHAALVSGQGLPQESEPEVEWL